LNARYPQQKVGKVSWLAHHGRVGIRQIILTQSRLSSQHGPDDPERGWHRLEQVAHREALQELVAPASSAPGLGGQDKESRAETASKSGKKQEKPVRFSDFYCFS
jgi:hypothetical protein